jgi:hypothetical protein
MKASEALEIVLCTCRFIFLFIEMKNARRRNDGHSDTS